MGAPMSAQCVRLIVSFLLQAKVRNGRPGMFSFGALPTFGPPTPAPSTDPPRPLARTGPGATLTPNSCQRPQLRRDLVVDVPPSDRGCNVPGLFEVPPCLGHPALPILLQTSHPIRDGVRGCRAYIRKGSLMELSRLSINANREQGEN